ncbi:hypothetical protein [Luteimonas sp. YGD11-2]|uniref:hypothetical protein n=1 Tax=Luteimonas sp. YGD11-2 TaxID=2508168 RepID=UPI001F508EAD|nr:hypothetical protein [Luteimonas sp. YGD11-2]
MEKLTALLAKIGLGRMSASEYRANLNGLNMFFGAVLGFVFAGTENLSDLQFGQVLLVLAGSVIAILFISSSRNRIVYSALALAYSAFLPEIIDLLLNGNNLVPGKIRPTLLTWALMTILVEFWARDKTPNTQG